MATIDGAQATITQATVAHPSGVTEKTRAGGRISTSDLAGAERAYTRAAREGDLEAVKFYGGYMDCANVSFFPFQAAASGGHLKILRFLYTKCGASNLPVKDNFELCVPVNHRIPKNEIAAAVHAASIRNYVDVVRYLMGLPGLDISVVASEAVIDAAEFDGIETLMYLATIPGVDMGYRGSKALIKAASHGRERAVEYLLKMSQVDPWARGSMAYFKAQFHKYNAIVDLIRDEMNRRLIQRQREYGMV